MITARQPYHRAYSMRISTRDRLRTAVSELVDALAEIDQYDVDSQAIVATRIGAKYEFCPSALYERAARLILARAYAKVQ